MVEPGARRIYGHAGIPQYGATRRTVGRGCTLHHRRSLDRAGAGEANGAGLGSWWVGFQLLASSFWLNPSAGKSPSQRAITTVVRQLPITLTAVRPMSIN